jgi:putative FmdB family regulatory protein
MPVYEYQCKACHRTFEYQQRMSDPDKTACEVCGGELERLISRTAFSLKGSGWYKDLYASPKPEGAAKPAEGQAKPDAGAAATPSTGGSEGGSAGSNTGSSSGGGSGGSSGGDGSSSGGASSGGTPSSGTPSSSTGGAT